MDNWRAESLSSKCSFGGSVDCIALGGRGFTYSCFPADHPGQTIAPKKRLRGFDEPRTNLRLPDDSIDCDITQRLALNQITAQDSITSGRGQNRIFGSKP